MSTRVLKEKRCKLCGKQRNNDFKEVHATESNLERKNLLTLRQGRTAQREAAPKKKLQTKLENEFEIL